MREQDDLADALTTLLQSDLRRALVLRDSRLVGVLSVSDVERLAKMRSSRLAANGKPGSLRSEHG